MRLKLIGVCVRWCATVFAYSRRSSVSGPRQKLCLWCEQLLVERRKQRVSCERVPLTKPAKLLHVQTAQRAQHRHPLVQLQGGHTHLDVSFLQQRGKPAILRVLTDMKHGAHKPLILVFEQPGDWNLPCASNFLDCLGAECVSVPTPRFFELFELCPCPPDTDDLNTKMFYERRIEFFSSCLVGCSL